MHTVGMYPYSSHALVKKKSKIKSSAGSPAMASQGASDLEMGTGIWENVPLTVRQAFIALNDSALAQARRIRLLERGADLREDLVKRVLAAVDDRLRGLDLIIKPSPPPPTPAAPSPELLRRIDDVEAKLQSLVAMPKRVQAVEDAQSSLSEAQERLEGKIKSLESGLGKLAAAIDLDASKLASFETRLGAVEKNLGTAYEDLVTKFEQQQRQAKHDDGNNEEARFKRVEQAIHASVEPIRTSLDSALGQIDAFRSSLSEWTERALTMDALEGVATVEQLDARVNEVEDAVLSALAVHNSKSPPPPPPLSSSLPPPTPPSQSSPYRAYTGALSTHDNETVRDLLLEVNALRRIVDFEISVGRWIWNGMALDEQGLVPWNVQCVNTAPDIFNWTADSPTVLAREQGLYEVAFGFFAERDVDVELLVNSETAVASSGHKATDFVRRGNHSAGNVTGWTYHNFLALPADASVEVRYLPQRSVEEEEAQGFLFMRKL